MADDGWIEITLRAIPEPTAAGRGGFDFSHSEHEGPDMVGTGGPKVRMRCGGCGRVLIEGWAVGQLQNAVFRCRCGTFNETELA